MPYKGLSDQIYSQATLSSECFVPTARTSPQSQLGGRVIPAIRSKWLFVQLQGQLFSPLQTERLISYLIEGLKAQSADLTSQGAMPFRTRLSPLVTVLIIRAVPHYQDRGSQTVAPLGRTPTPLLWRCPSIRTGYQRTRWNRSSLKHCYQM